MQPTDVRYSDAQSRSLVIRTYALSAAARMQRTYWLGWFRSDTLGVQMTDTSGHEGRGRRGLRRGPLLDARHQLPGVPHVDPREDEGSARLHDAREPSRGAPHLLEDRAAGEGPDPPDQPALGDPGRRPAHPARRVQAQGDDPSR